jgi:hypothetical protein
MVLVHCVGPASVMIPAWSLKIKYQIDTGLCGSTVLSSSCCMAVLCCMHPHGCGMVDCVDPLYMILMCDAASSLHQTELILCGSTVLHVSSNVLSRDLVGTGPRQGGVGVLLPGTRRPGVRRGGLASPRPALLVGTACLRGGIPPAAVAKGGQGGRRDRELSGSKEGRTKERREEQRDEGRNRVRRTGSPPPYPHYPTPAPRFPPPPPLSRPPCSNARRAAATPPRHRPPRGVRGRGRTANRIRVPRPAAHARGSGCAATPSRQGKDRAGPAGGEGG